MKLLISFFLIFSTVSAAGQDYRFVNYSKNQGLPAQLVDMTQDRNGNLWMTGLLGQFYYFDGIENKTFSFPDHLFTNSIYRIAAGADNKIWLLTDRGLISFDGESYNLINLPSKLVAGYESKLMIDANNRVWILDVNGHVGFTGVQGITIFDHSSESGELITDLGVDDKENILLATSSGSFLKINPDLNLEIVVIDELRGKKIESFDFMDGTMTVASEEYIYIINERAVSQKFYRGSINFAIRQLMRDRHGILWIRGNGKLLRLTNGAFSEVDESHGLTDNLISRIFRDDGKGLWVLTDAKGTFKQNNQPFTQVEVSDESIVSAILPISAGEVLLGTYGKGVFIWRDQSVKKIHTGSALDHSIVLGIKGHAPSEYYVGTHGNGLFDLQFNDDLRSPRLFKVAQPSYIKFVRHLTVVGDSLFAATKEGFYALRDGKWTGLAENSKLTINCFLQLNQHKILIGSSAQGLLIAENGKLNRVDTSFFKSTTINTIRQDKRGNIWVGSSRSGIAIYNGHLKRIATIPNSMESTGTVLIEFIDQATALIGLAGASNNLMIIRFSSDYQVSSHRTYGPANGWPDPALVLGASAVSADGSIWIGTSLGAFRFDPTNDFEEKTEPRTFLRKVALLNPDKSIDDFITTKAGLFRLPDELRLPYDANSLAFSYRASDLSSPRSLRYRFRMVGLENEWSGWTSQDEIIYSSISPGSYRFEVQAISDQGLAGTPATYSFVIEKAYWQTWWFYSALAIALFTAIIVANRIYYRFKISEFKKQAELKRVEALRIKQQMSMDFHDELGNKLAGVMSYASTLRVKGHTKEVDSALEYIETSAHEIFHKTKDFIWALDVESNNLFEVLIYLRDFGAKFFERNQIEFEVIPELNVSKFSIPLREGYNRQIILIFKEGMTNILKHAQCTRVQFDASVENDGSVVLSLEDNGSGLPVKKSGNGLRNMKKRADVIAASFELDKSELGGLKISLTFKP